MKSLRQIGGFGIKVELGTNSSFGIGENFAEAVESAKIDAEYTMKEFCKVTLIEKGVGDTTDAAVQDAKERLGRMLRG